MELNQEPGVAIQLLQSSATVGSISAKHTAGQTGLLPAKYFSMWRLSALQLDRKLILTMKESKSGDDAAAQRR